MMKNNLQSFQNPFQNEHSFGRIIRIHGENSFRPLEKNRICHQLGRKYVEIYHFGLNLDVYSSDFWSLNLPVMISGFAALLWVD
jgi:hypothetical protein